MCGFTMFFGHIQLLLPVSHRRGSSHDVKQLPGPVAHSATMREDTFQVKTP